MADKSSRLESKLIPTFLLILTTLLMASFCSLYHLERGSKERLRNHYESRLEHMERMYEKEIETREYFHNHQIELMEDLHDRTIDSYKKSYEELSNWNNQLIKNSSY